jgi:carbonic anhydrase/acetyltransferase-like protein (isoleucine patch superfamily)
MQSRKPIVHSSSYIDESAVLIGDVIIGKQCGILPQAVIRGDKNSIKIMDGSNVQDSCIIHVDESHPTFIGKKVSIGHGAIVHGATIEDACIIGMHATILNGATIKKGTIIGAHTLVTSDSVIPEHSLVIGIPGKVVKNSKNYEQQAIKNAEIYINLSKQYLLNEYKRFNKQKM